MQYTLEYFINKFNAIPEAKWSGIAAIADPTYINKNFTCAMGHCGGYPSISQESRALAHVLKDWYKIHNLACRTDGAIIFEINDNNMLCKEPTPKQRILKALNDIKEHQINSMITKALYPIIGEGEESADEMEICPDNGYGALCDKF